jgi:hypothetical protein
MWFFGYAEINGAWTTSEPREFTSRDEAEHIGAWPGLFTAGPYATEQEARERMAEMDPSFT